VIHTRGAVLIPFSASVKVAAQYSRDKVTYVSISVNLHTLLNQNVHSYASN
jgi:hypothetical protein